MSLLLFSDVHLDQILTGEKTQTRRQWDSPRLTAGNSYRAVPMSAENPLFVPRADAPAYVLVDSVYEERLGALSEQDAAAEGGYTVAEFKSLWRDINGAWDADERVWVVEFTASETDPREQPP